MLSKPFMVPLQVYHPENQSSTIWEYKDALPTKSSATCLKSECFAGTQTSEDEKPSLVTHYWWHDSAICAQWEAVLISLPTGKEIPVGTGQSNPSPPGSCPTECSCHLQPPSPILPTALPCSLVSSGPVPLLLLGFPSSHKNHQAKQEQNESWKIRHPVNVCDAASYPSRGPASKARLPPGLTIESDPALSRRCEGEHGWPDASQSLILILRLMPTLYPFVGCREHNSKGFALPCYFSDWLSSKLVLLWNSASAVSSKTLVKTVT